MDDREVFLGLRLERARYREDGLSCSGAAVRRNNKEDFNGNSVFTKADMPTSGAMYAVQFVDCMLKLQIEKNSARNWVEAPVGVVGVGRTDVWYSADPLVHAKMGVVRTEYR